MRWRIPPPPPKPKVGDLKVVRKFLLIPRTQRLPDGTRVIRWLCAADVVYYYAEPIVGYEDYTPSKWRFKGFADELLLDKIEGQP